MRHAFVLEHRPLSNTVQTLAVWHDGEIAQNFEETAQHPPFQALVETGTSQYCPKNLQQRYPEIQIFQTMAAVCFLGVPLLDSQGNALGALCIVHDQALPYPQEAQTVMTIFAARAAAELQRQRAELALRKAYSSMEQQVKERTIALSNANTRLTQVAQCERATTRIIQQMRQSLDLEKIFDATIQELRHVVNCDRVIIYRFAADWSGHVVAESVGAGWQTLLPVTDSNAAHQANLLQEERCTVRILSSDSTVIQDTYLQEHQGGIYAQGVDYITVDDK